MKKYMMIILMVTLWASPAAAQEARGAKGEAQEVYVDGLIAPLYTGLSFEGSNRAGEYEYLKSSAGLNMHLEYDPLPHRFAIETHYLNNKDYFSDLDYAYRDVVLFNLIMRGLNHNLDHYAFGSDDPLTVSPSSIDLNPTDKYFIENSLRKGFIRLKTPDFPFHVYADVLQVDRKGTVQQRFLRGFSGGLNRVSESRDIDWSSSEIKVGVNSHLGPVEVDYSHTEKKFEPKGDAAMYDAYPTMTVPHNLTPELTSSTDTIKLHSALTGRIVASATMSEGKKKNEDSGTKADFRNSAGDLVLTPVSGLVLFIKYRHSEVNAASPDLVTLSGLNYTYDVRQAISSKKDVVSGAVRYRISDRMNIRGEYALESITRDAGHGNNISVQVNPTQSGTQPDFWDVAERTTKSTAKLGITYRILSKVALRADYSAVQVTNPAYANDPDQAQTAKASVTWTPGKKVIALVSYGGIREKRNDLTAPLAGGSRKADRDQALGSLTLLLGKRSSVTASAMFYQNKTKETLTYQDASGAYILENSVPYGDKAQVYSLALTQSLGEGITVMAEGSKCYSQGSFRVDGSMPNSSGIDVLSDIRVIEDTYAAGMEVQVNKNVSGELRYLHRQYRDEIDNTQDGKLTTVLATVSVKW